jgi:hypothetical protein
MIVRVGVGRVPMTLWRVESRQENEKKWTKFGDELLVPIVKPCVSVPSQGSELDEASTSYPKVTIQFTPVVCQSVILRCTNRQHARQNVLWIFAPIFSIFVDSRSSY